MHIIPSILIKNDCYKANKKITPKGILMHSTGCNNPNLSRYCVNEEHLGKSSSNNWNQPKPDKQQKCVHAFIGYDKNKNVQVAQTLPWDHRCWGCGSGSKGSYNNSHIQFEICEDNLESREYFEAAYNKAVELCVWLCKEYSINPANIVCHSEAHKLGYGSNHADVMHWFPKHGKDMEEFRRDVQNMLLASEEEHKENEVNAQLAVNKENEENEVNAQIADNEKRIWTKLMNHFNNHYGVAGLMGNIKAESNLRPNNLQNSYEKKLGLTDDEYVEAVDNNTYNNFTHDKAGFGLVQHTFWSRKQNLYNYMKARNLSIADLDGQVDFIIEELKGYKTVYNTLKTATSIRQASDAVLTGYEKPADQSEAVKERRAGFGLEIYSRQTAPTSFRVKIKADCLNIRAGASTSYKKVGQIKDHGVYTIIETNAEGTFGLLKSKVGWISIRPQYVIRL